MGMTVCVYSNLQATCREGEWFEAVAEFDGCNSLLANELSDSCHECFLTGIAPVEGWL